MKRGVVTVACLMMLVAAAGQLEAGLYLLEHAHTSARANAEWNFGGLDAGTIHFDDDDGGEFYATSYANTVGGLNSGGAATATAGGSVMSPTPNALARAEASANALGQNFPLSNQYSWASGSADASWSDEVILLNPTETSKTVSLKFRLSGTVKVVENLAPAARGEASAGVSFQGEFALAGASFRLKYQRYDTGYVFTHEELGWFDTLQYGEINMHQPGIEYYFEGEITQDLLLYRRPQMTGDDRLLGIFTVALSALAYNEGGESIADASHTLELVSIRDAETGENLSDVVFLGSGMAVPVPEPTSLAFFGISALGVAVKRRRKRVA